MPPQPSAPPPVAPAYGDGSLADVVPALLAPGGARPGWLPAAAAEGPAVLLVLDGLGWTQLEARRHLAPTMAAMAGGAITSVAPTTTATALTSITTGAPPARHGVVGYKVAVEGPSGREVMNVLRWRTASGDARGFVDPLAFQVLPAFAGRPVPVVSRREFEGTGFSTAHMQGARQAGWVVPSSLPVLVAREAAAGEALTYAYYEGVDKVAHVHGFGEEYDAELAAADRLVGDLLDALPPHVTLLVTADHGQVEVGGRAEPLDEGVLEAAELVSGEARWRWLHARPGAAGDLAAAALARYGDQAWVRTVDEVEEAGWLGGPLDTRARERLGDVAVIPWEPVGYLDAGDGDTRLVCRHGSLTADEVLVPLLATRGRHR